MYHTPPDSIARYAKIKFQVLLKTFFIMLGIGGFADFWNYFIKKFVYIVLTKKYDKLFRFKYLL